VTVAVIITLVVVIGLVTTGFLVALRIFRDLSSRCLNTLDQMHLHASQAQDKLLDRLMTIKWEDYVAVQSMEEAEPGGFFSPEEQSEEVTEVIRPPVYGLHLHQPDNEDVENELAILREDFPEG